MLQYLLTKNSKCVTNSTDNVQIVNKPTHISETLIGHVFIKKTLMEEFFTSVAVENISFWDHVAIRILIVILIESHINP